MKKVIIVQVRLSSTRLPAKSVKKIKDKTLIEHIAARLKKVKGATLVFAVPECEKELALFLKNKNLNVFKGDLNNVLKRYYDCGSFYKAGTVVRVTGDNPLVWFEKINFVINKMKAGGYDYAIMKGAPLGTGFEVFSFAALKKTYLNAKRDYEKEHVTPYIYENPSKFKILHINSPLKSGLRFTVDTQEDFDFVSKIYKKLYTAAPIPTRKAVLFSESLNKKNIPNFNITQKSYKPSSAFITYASKETGTGHIIRTKYLYEELKKKGKNIILFLNENSPVNIKEAVSYKTPIDLVKKLKSFYINFYFTDVHNTRSPLGDFLKNKKWLNYEDVSLYKNKSLFYADAHKKIKNLKRKKNTFLGPAYAVIRKEILNLKRKTKNENILITLGAAPSLKDIKKIIKSVLNNKQYKFYVLSLKKIKGLPKNTFVLNDAQKAFKECSFAFSSGGVSALECAALKIPAVITALNGEQYENQKNIGVYPVYKLNDLKNIDIEPLRSLNSKKLNALSGSLHSQKLIKLIERLIQ